MEQLLSMEALPSYSGPRKINEQRISSIFKLINNYAVIIKLEKSNEVRQDLQVLSETLIEQFVLVKDLLINGWKHNYYQRFTTNEDRVKSLRKTILQKLTVIVIQFSPKGKDLRTIVYCHEVILYMELIGEFLTNIVEIMKESDFKSDDYEDYEKTLSKFFEEVKETIREACYSFYNEDAKLAYKILQPIPYKEMEKLKTDTLNSILSNFEEIPLLKQELINLMAFDKILFIMKKIDAIAINIAKSTIFVIEGNLNKS